METLTLVFSIVAICMSAFALGGSLWMLLNPSIRVIQQAPQYIPQPAPPQPESPPAKLIDYNQLELTAKQIAEVQAGKAVKDEKGHSWDMM